MVSAVGHGPDKIKELCEQMGKETQRVDPRTKEECEIYQYQYKHQSGIAYFYKNLTSDKTLQEKLTFNLSGLQIEGNEEGDNVVEFKLGPNQTKLVELKSIAPQWKIACSLAYGIM